MEVWNFIQNQILGMKWLNTLIGDLLSKFGLDLESRIGGSLQFFFYDVIKIFILLSVLIFGISYIQSFFRRSVPSRSYLSFGVYQQIFLLRFWER